VGNAFGDWGFKDPRTVLLWPLYRETLADLDPRLLVTQRGPMALMRSWLATGWVESEAQALKLLDYYDDRFIAIKADAVERGWPVLQVVFEDWWDDLNGQRERLSRFLGRDADVSHFDPALGRSGKGRDS
jgi:hypothetical protein